MEPDEMGCSCRELYSDAIALLEDRLSQARSVIEDFVGGPYTYEEKTCFARDALAEIWPTPPKPRVVEVGVVYKSKNGMIWHCVAKEGDRALMTLRAPDGGLASAYVWSLDGKSTLSDDTDIDWSRS